MPTIFSTDPSHNYRVLGSIESTSDEEIQKCFLRAKQAQQAWGAIEISKRVSFLRKAYDHFLQKKDILARSISSEMGMPVRLARDEVQCGLNYFLWYLENAEKYLSPQVTFESPTERHQVHFQPKGIIAAITPWNYPFMLFVWACIQPLLAGNVVLWKISKEVILTGKLIAEIMESSNIPIGVWQEVYGDGMIGDTITDLDIHGITFTGSTKVGELLQKKAQARSLPIVAELGGSAPGIVCEDADIDSIVETIYFMRFSNSGQMCDGLKRLIVHESRYLELIEKLTQKLYSKKIGDPLDENTDIGPLASGTQKAIFEEQFSESIERGGSLLAQHTPDEMLVGAFVPAYIIGNIDRDMRIWKEEVFGPLLPIVTYKTIDEAIELANDTVYGLGAYIFTENKDVFSSLAMRIESGMVQMNAVNYCIPQNPFGGYKLSGFGREHGSWGFYEFSNTKVLSEPK